jgi:hypothetical protein
MRFIDTTASLDFARKALESASDFSIVARNLIIDVRNSYRPELHYMRGPGPKWRAKYQARLRFDSESASLTWRAPQRTVVPARLSGNTTRTLL